MPLRAPLRVYMRYVKGLYGIKQVLVLFRDTL